MVGPYEVIEELGRGGLGTVYRATDPRLGRNVAIKVLRADRATGGEGNRWETELLEEARKVATLDHPGLVRVYDSGRVELSNAETEGDSTETTRDSGSGPIQTLFVVYEYIPGLTMTEWLNRDRPHVRDKVEVILRICESLEYVHQSGLLHQDLKPGNIVLNLNHYPRLIDFGLATRLGDQPGMSHTATPLFGTPPYMAPERWNAAGGRLDCRTDIYSLGVMMYESLVGKLPHGGSVRGESDLRNLRHEICNRDPISPSQVFSWIPEELSRICLKAMARDRDERFGSAAEMARELRGYLGQPCDTSGVLLVGHGVDGGWWESQKQLILTTFQHHEPPLSLIPNSPIEDFAEDAAMNGNRWRDVLTRTIRLIRHEQAQMRHVHLVPRLKTACAYALGTLLDNQYDYVLYHVQSGRVYQIWRTDRSIKSLRSPRAGQPFTYQFFDVRDIDVRRDESNPIRPESSRPICLVAQIGANELLPHVQRWRNAECPSAEIRVMTKVPGELPPDATDHWIRAAAELAHAIQTADTEDVYLIIDGPAVLALMAGDAIGRNSGKRVHLVQFDDRSPLRSDSPSYQDILVLPDPELGVG